MFKTKEEIKTWLDKMGIEKYTINDDLTVDVDGNVNLYAKGLTKIPVQFNIITGNFGIAANFLKSLKGSPLIVKGSFNCNNNYLKTLQYCPKFVVKTFLCQANSLTSLKYLGNVKGQLFCDDYLYDEYK